MRQSQLFTRTTKEPPKDEVSTNAQLLLRAGFIDKLAGGVYSFLPLGLKTFRKIENIIREEMNAIGGQEILMPSLHPKSAWESTGRWEGFDVLFKLKDLSGREFALGATHEEIVVPLVAKHVQSYKDLPFSVYQIQTKFRMELRSKSGLLRGREFSMKDLYSFHETEADLDEYYARAQQAYETIFQRLGIGEQTLLTYAAGGTFAKYSHEYQALCEAGEDIVFICNTCNTAVNEEIIEETPKCPKCGSDDYRKAKSIEVGNIFKLKDKFSAPFNFSIKNINGEEVNVLMGCYGIGLGRAMGTIAELNRDERGLVWPESVAPFRVHVISLNEDKKATELYTKLTQSGIEVLLDDRDVRAGEKFTDSDLIGIPYRVVVSAKSTEKGGVEIKKRNEEMSQIVSFDKVVTLLKAGASKTQNVHA